MTTPDNSAQLRIEEFFDDPVLVHLIHQALAGNQELKILAQDVRIANYEFLARRGALFPFVAVRAGAGLEKTSRYTRNGAVEDQLEILPGKRFPDPLPNFLVAADVTWQIDIWRKLRNARDAAVLRYFATADGRNYVVTRLVADVAENYYGLLALDKRLENLDQTIALQEASLEVAIARFDKGRGSQLAVQRFRAEVRRNQSERLVIQQDIIETENRINFLAGRYPQRVERSSTDFFNLNLNSLRVGVPSQLLRNRPDIRQAELELEAAGLDVKVARAEFLPSLVLNGGVGYEAFNPRYLFNPEALAASVAGGLVAPLINRTAIQVVYGSANARQLQAVYNYQRVILDAFTEVVNRVSMAENYRQSLDLRRQQLQSLEASVESATQLFNNARAEYLEVLFAQRDLRDARMAAIDTKRQQLSAIVNAYQSLGGGGYLCPVLNTDPPHPSLIKIFNKLLNKAVGRGEPSSPPAVLLERSGPPPAGGQPGERPLDQLPQVPPVPLGPPQPLPLPPVPADKNAPAPAGPS